MREARQWRDQQTLHAKRRPVALRVLDQLVRPTDPYGLATALKPIVEDDAGRLASFARARAVAEHEASPKPDRVGCALWCGLNEVVGFIDGPRPREKIPVRFAGVDDGFELSIGQQRVDVCWQRRSVAGLGRRDRGHGRRLHEFGGVGLRSRNTDRLKSVAFIEAIAHPVASGRRPIDGLIDKINRFRIGGDVAGRTGGR